MNNSHKELFSVALTLGVVFFALFIIHRFIPSVVWAGIIAMATYPLYQRWRLMFGSQKNASALLFTFVLALLLVVPLSWLISILVRELQVLLNYLQSINQHGGEAPLFVQDMPWVGRDMVSYWNAHIGQPGYLKHELSNLHLSLTPISHYVKQVSFDLFHRGVQIGFTLLSLFFFYRDGDQLIKAINRIGDNCLGARWYRYAEKLPVALRGTVNGTVFVGLGVGILMGICYGLVGFPGPTLLGFVTSCAAMVPFVAPIIFIIVAVILWCTGSVLSAVAVLTWGTLVMFFADHFVKPALIGGAIELPFLAVLFGILGGVETLGLLGLFIGPIVMVLFVTLWTESQDKG
jgi:predicted PurR-regulated permease PerM